MSYYGNVLLAQKLYAMCDAWNLSRVGNLSAKQFTDTDQPSAMEVLEDNSTRHTVEIGLKA